MPVVRTVVTSLPQTASTEKTYRIDPAPEAPAQAISSQSAAGRPRSKVILGQTLLSVNLSQLLADLEAESRRIIGPTAPPRG